MRKLLVIVLLFSLYSCTSSDAEKMKIVDNAEVRIDLGDKQQKYSLDTLIEDIKCVRMEDTGKAKLSGVQGLEKAIVRNDTIYMLDKRFSSIKAYNDKGKYLFNVGETGLTDDKYLIVEDMVYNKEGNSLWVICNTPRKIVEYSMDGRYQRKINIKFFASSVGIVAANTFYYYTNQNNSPQTKNKNLLITDSNNVVRGREFDFLPNGNIMIDFTGGIFRTNDKLYFNPPYTGSYYLLDQDKIAKAYSVELGESSGDVSGSKLRPCLGKSFIEMGGYVIFNFQKNGISETGVYDKKSNKVYTNDMSLNPINFLFNSKVMAQEGNDLVLFVEPRYLQNVLKKNETVLKQRFPDAYQQLYTGDTSINAAGISMVKLKLKHA